MGAESVGRRRPQPGVEGAVEGRGRQQRIVVDPLRVVLPTPRRLHADEDVAERQSGRRTAGVPARPVRRRAGLRIVGAAGDQAPHQVVAGCRSVRDGVAGGAEGAEQVDERGRRVQTDAVADAPVARRRVAEHDGQAPLTRRGAAQPGPGGRLAGEGVAATGVRDVAPAGAVATALLLEGDGHGDDSPVELGHRHLHRHVQRAQPGGAPLPGRPAVRADQGLQDGHPQPGEPGPGRAPRLGRLLPAVHRLRPHAPGGEAERADQDVDPRPAAGVEEVALQEVVARLPGPPGAVSGRAQAGAEDGQSGAAGAVEGVDQGVDEGQVPAQPVGAVEDDPDHRSLRGPGGERPPPREACRPRRAAALRGRRPEGRAQQRVREGADGAAGVLHPPVGEVGRDPGGQRRRNRGQRGQRRVLAPLPAERDEGVAAGRRRRRPTAATASGVARRPPCRRSTATPRPGTAPARAATARRTSAAASAARAPPPATPVPRPAARPAPGAARAGPCRRW